VIQKNFLAARLAQMRGVLVFIGVAGFTAGLVILGLDGEDRVLLRMLQRKWQEGRADVA